MIDSSEAIAIVVVGCGGLVAIIAPILKLNTSIVTLTNTIESFKERMSLQQKTLDKHEDDIKELKFEYFENSHILKNHETRLKSLEHKSVNEN